MIIEKKHGGSCKDVRQNNKERSYKDRKLDKRGETKGKINNETGNNSDKQLTDLMVNGRLEM